jgi:hypothetical protein
LPSITSGLDLVARVEEQVALVALVLRLRVAVVQAELVARLERDEDFAGLVLPLLLRDLLQPP